MAFLTLLRIMACLSAATSAVYAVDIISNITVLEVTRTTATLEWGWIFDDDDNNNPEGVTIVTSLVENKIRSVHEVDIPLTATNYTVAENLTSWERYQSCFSLLFPEGISALKSCSEYYITQYDPWTRDAELAVIVTAGLLIFLIIAVVINTVWPRSEKRTFTMDTNELEDDDEKIPGDPHGAKDNLGFQYDEDVGSVVDDWNAAAAAAVTRRTPGGKEWSKTAQPHHEANQNMLEIEKMFYDRNHNRDQDIDQPDAHVYDLEYELGAEASGYHEDDRIQTWLDDQLNENPQPDNDSAVMPNSSHHYDLDEHAYEPSGNEEHVGYEQSPYVVTHCATIEREDPDYF